MKTKILFFAATAILLLAGGALLAQTPVIDFDDNTGKWAVGLAEPNINSASIADNFTDVYEGNGAMEVTVALRNYAFAWGTWTDFQYTFPSTANFRDADEVRFWIKILDAPKNRRGLQFTCDFYDQPAGAAGSELWRYYDGLGDRDIFYTNVSSDWFEVVVPFSRLTKPVWATPFNDHFDPSDVVTFGFGVHGDSSATDSVRFVIDNLYVSKSNRVAPILSFDDNVGKFAVSLAEPTVNSATVADNFIEVVEGNGSVEISVALRHYAFPWGTWTDFRHDFPAPVDLTGATEFRFAMRILTPPTNVKSLQFTADLFDQPAGAAGGELFRWPAQYGLFYGPNQNRWVEIVVPFKDMATPVWATAFNGQLDLNAIVSFAFGVHGDSTRADSLVFVFDDLRATNGTQVPTAVADRPNLHVPSVFALDQNYPNPFNPTTTIDFVLAESGITSLKVYDVNGKLVQTVFENANKLRGTYSFDVDMSRHPSGVYFYILEQGSTRLTKKMTLMK